MKPSKSRVALRLIARFFLLLVTISVIGVAGLTVWAISLIPELPKIESIADLKLKVPLRIYSSDGLLLAEYGDERRVPVRIENAPPALINAVLAAEDDRFYAHTGVDLIGIARAMLVNIKARSIEQGASTITMQVARNYFLTRDRTYIRKAKEALLAFQLEQLLTKDEILELYINKIFLGHRSYGFGAAARTYYGKPLSELTIAQCAMLAALPKSPSRVNPLTNPAAARDRRDYVLDRMAGLGLITTAEHEEAINSEITAENHIAVVELDAPFVAELVRQEMLEKFGQNAYEDGYQVYSTIHSKQQIAARDSLRKGLMDYDLRHGYRGAVRQYDLNTLATEEDWNNAIRHVPKSKELVPVLVLEVSEENATAHGIDLGKISIPWESMKWARQYITSRSIGEQPEQPSDVLTPGDIVYVKPNDDSWALSQLPEIEGALVAISPIDGAIRAVQGGFDYYLGKFNRATQAFRQVGSNIKPFVYSAALESGYSAASMVSSAPVVVEDEAQKILWRPENYSGKFFGPTRLRKALSLSLNLVSVRLVRSMGTEFTTDYLSRFGFDPNSMPIGLSLALGSAEVTPLNVVSAYAVFANNGYAVAPYIIDFIKDRDGRVIERGRQYVVCETCLLEDKAEFYEDDEVSPNGQVHIAPRVISSANAYIMNSMLREVVQTGTARRAKALNRTDLAGKTGTTNNFEDAWFSGFNGHLVATAWVGFDSPKDMGRHEAGSKAALPIWVDFMKEALDGVNESKLIIPDNIVNARVHTETGELVEHEDPDGYTEVFVFGTEPTTQSGGYGGVTSTPFLDSDSTDESENELF